MSTLSRKYYWIDCSCDEAAGGNFDTYIFEAQHWANRAYERLRSPSDTDFARVFNVIFKTPKADTMPCSKPSFWQQVNGIHPENEWKPSAHHVLAALHDFAHNWSRTPHREKADVRLYSNRGLARWQPAPNGNIYDPINHILLTGDWANLTTGQAFTSYLLPHTAPNPNENPRRVTIDICPSAWPTTAGSPLSLTHLNPATMTTDPNLTIADLSPTLLPRLLLHEFMHSRAYLLDDHPSDGDTSGWEYCMRRKKGEAAGCAESVAMLGLWAGLADLRPAGRSRGGFTMDRGWDSVPGAWDDEEGFSDDDEEGQVRAGKWDVGVKGNGAVRGEVVFYEDVTR